ncbi:ABC transporter substrate-binding protein [Acidisphaera sp. L21]|uniref:ABC transporter substrate-binding protein n=1 Tax=Acidisphaera sp. L21 TaxID=1641851 RepID=UPI00131D8B9B|nr:ABC transporter substrate-binding protein [Acidisphaera sp. L21]
MIRILAVLFSLAFSLSAQAASEAAAPIEALDQGLLSVMHAGKSTPFGQRFATLSPVVQHAFDLETILETSVGPRWKSFTPDQQQALQAEFLRFTVASYVSNFSSFDGEKFTIDPDTRAVGAEQVVATHIIPASGDPARIDYVMRQGSNGWQAVDVLLDGSISRVAVQRSDFRSLLSGGPDALVASLRKKVSDLSGGASVP